MTKNVADITEPVEIVKAMGERNPGGISVMTDIYRSTDVVTLSMIAHWLDLAGIYGSDIWVGYKDHCNHDLAMFIECVSNADPDMLKTINDYREQ